jgi:hyperosmotically inducible periplasmic protein
MNRLLRSVLLVGLGATLAYLFDPDRGKGRRAKLADQTRARARDAADEVSKKSRYEAGRVRGMAHEVFSSETPPRNDAELLQKVRSEALGPAGLTGDIEIRIDDGVVVLEGPGVGEERQHDLIDRIEKVVGVTGVRNEMRST